MSILEDLNGAIASIWEESQRTGWALQVDVSSVPRRTLRRLYPNRSRRSRRTDFARPGRFRFFSRGRSYPTSTLAVGYPDVIRYVVGMQVGPGTVVAIEIPRGMLWVTP